MSMQFDEPISPEMQKAIKEMKGLDTVAVDESQALFNRMAVNRRDMTELANKLGQPVAVEMNSLGDIKEMADGARYQLSIGGWRRL